MNNTIELMREYVRVADMCKGTNVKPWECVKLHGNVLAEDPKFYYREFYKNYTFAIAILEGKPVFVGDVVYSKLNYGAKINWDLIIDDWNCWTWTPPTKKRTFMLNGAELPCPIKASMNEFNFGLSITVNDSSLHGSEFYFNNPADTIIFYRQLITILTEARDKE